MREHPVVSGRKARPPPIHAAWVGAIPWDGVWRSAQCTEKQAGGVLQASCPPPPPRPARRDCLCCSAVRQNAETTPAPCPLPPHTHQMKPRGHTPLPTRTRCTDRPARVVDAAHTRRAGESTSIVAGCRLRAHQEMWQRLPLELKHTSRPDRGLTSNQLIEDSLSYNVRWAICSERAGACTTHSPALPSPLACVGHLDPPSLPHAATTTSAGRCMQ